MIDSSAEGVLQLLRKALNPSWQIVLPEGIDWNRSLELALGQGVSGLCSEAFNQLPAGNIPKPDLLQWLGQTELQRGQYERAWTVASKLDRMWAAEGIHAIVLKGRSIAKYYQVPHYRFSCDLDVFIEQDWERACKLLEERGVQLGHEVYKEVEFTMDNIYVECHRYITPLRGNRKLKEFERYLRSLLKREPNTYFEGTTLVCPSLMFTALLYMEHALGDFLHGHLLLKHVVDWVVLRRQNIDWWAFRTRCKVFKFDRFVGLIDSLADVVEGKNEYESLQPKYQEAFDDMFKVPKSTDHQSWFKRRVALFFNIVKNDNKYRDFGYTSMPSFLFSSLWSHFFDKEVRL